MMSKYFPNLLAKTLRKQGTVAGGVGELEGVIADVGVAIEGLGGVGGGDPFDFAQGRVWCRTKAPR